MTYYQQTNTQKDDEQTLNEKSTKAYTFKL